MSWFKIDDGWWSHPKTLRLSSDAVALWARAGSWSCQHLTDGFIPLEAMKAFGIATTVAAELVKVGYWDKTRGGWTFHDWDDYQERSEVVKKRRDGARERMRAVRANKTGTSQEVRSTPTRPDPTRPISNVSEIKSGVSTALVAPPAHCPKHIDVENPPNCGPCKEARLNREAWIEAHPKPTVSGIQNDPVCEHHLPPKQCLRCREAVAS